MFFRWRITVTATVNTIEAAVSHMAPSWLHCVTVGTVVSGFVLLAFTIPSGMEGRVRVAFVGNSMMFVNDMPRFMETLSDGRILQQNSCLHGSVSFSTILRKGNGMYQRWKTKKARMDNGIWDFGACTVPQLLLGQDRRLTLGNKNGFYWRDGLNPCMESEPYYRYLLQEEERNTPSSSSWDFVVLNDHTKKPGLPQYRRRSLKALRKTFAPALRRTGAVPILMATHGYVSNQTTMNTDTMDLGNVSDFTTSVLEGYLQYASLLEQELPPKQKPLIAPTGVAFLYVYEQDPDMWEKLFFIDNFHPSPHGSYLMGCVLHTTMFGTMPPFAHDLTSKYYQAPELLWQNARKMQLAGYDPMDWPESDDLEYLNDVCQKVGLNGVLPDSLGISV